MSFEDFDKKIREAAEHHHPSYDENAWKGMKVLLDKHLPEEDKDRRRIFFFLLLALLLGVGSFLVLGRSGKKQPQASQVQTTRPAGMENTKPATSLPDETAKNDTAAGKKNTPVTDLQQGDLPAAQTTTPAERSSVNAISLQKKPVQKNNRPSNVIRTAAIPALSKNNPAGKTEQKQPVAPKDKSMAVHKPNAPVSTDAAVTDVKKTDAGHKKAATGLPVTGNPPALPGDDKKTADIAGAEPVAAANQKQPMQQDNTVQSPAPGIVATAGKKKKAGGKKNSFSLSLSAGPDISYAGREQWGKTKLVLGLGLGYSIGDKLLIRSGFFTAQKIYDASSKSYNPPASFYTYYPYLYGVNADCRVYEIPLLFSYRFGSPARHKGLLTAGLSSYIMKRETYDYTYSYVPSGPVYKHSYTLENENSHWFSVLTLSGGYQWQAGKNISLMAEPYLKLPLNGVGFGKVKLKSTGILFTVGINPFAKQQGVKKRNPGNN